MSRTAELAADIAAAGIGHNSPPEPTAFDAFQAHINDLMDIATGLMDGEPITSERQAEEIASLLDDLRRAKKDADAARADEKKPHDDAAKAVQSKWKPLLDRCDIAATTAKNHLAPWLMAKEAAQQAEAERKRKEAEALAIEAAKAARSAAANDLASREDAARVFKLADAANKAAHKAEKARANTAGGSRAVALRSYFTATLTDPVEALRHYKATRPDALKAFLQECAQTDVLNGARSIPGFTILEERKAV